MNLFTGRARLPPSPNILTMVVWKRKFGLGGSLALPVTEFEV
jgi:hypothetical protein